MAGMRYVITALLATVLVYKQAGAVTAVKTDQVPAMPTDDSIRKKSESEVLTARMVTQAKLRAHPSWRYRGWKNWNGGSWNWQHEPHSYPYYYKRYYPHSSHYYAYIPYYDYWLTPSYDYPSTSLKSNAARLQSKYHTLERTITALQEDLARSADKDRVLELEHAICRHKLELDRINQQIYYLRTQ